MDQLKDFASGNKSEENKQTSSSSQNDDYGDKAADMANDKYLGGKLSDSQLEKGTDAIREGVEKYTGKDIPDKVSN
ncbi:hypothetical protein F4780DRAFT_784145 [Xylariomycetidae sp. FL0641]|nr:hypothetical protein F4780DRAFT_784145 [Xylariomycetidae sp. FL0641]